jgi:cytochrome bd-type quinol oxidase subunit 1
MNASRTARSNPSRTSDPAPARSTATGLAARYAEVRQATLDLAAPLTPEDCQVQSMPDASPTKWHLAHITWFFETFILERFEAGFQPFDPGFRVLFNSYYQGVGERYPRPQRGLITRPTLETVKRYRADVENATGDEIAKAALDTVPDVWPLFWSFRIMVGVGFFYIAFFAFWFWKASTRMSAPRDGWRPASGSSPCCF